MAVHVARKKIKWDGGTEKCAVLETHAYYRLEPRTKEPTMAAPMAKPYFQETGLATMPGAAFLCFLVEFLEAEAEAEWETEETEEAATTPVETRALLVWTEAEEETTEEEELCLAIVYVCVCVCV